MKIIVGMSGVVDSSAAAALLKEQGHEVTGVMMTVWDGSPSSAEKKHACYGPDEDEDVREAESVCRYLGIPFHRFNLASEYRSIVLEDFRNEYLSARTPNPCVRCNQQLKFGLLPEAAKRAGSFSTGLQQGITRERDRTKEGILFSIKEPMKERISRISSIAFLGSSCLQCFSLSDQ